MPECLYCGQPSPGKWCSRAHKDLAWTNRRNLGALMVEAGLITDADLAALERVRGAVGSLAALVREEGLSGACTGKREEVSGRTR